MGGVAAGETERRSSGELSLHDFARATLGQMSGRRSKSGLPGRYEPFCREGVTSTVTSYQILTSLCVLRAFRDGITLSL